MARRESEAWEACWAIICLVLGEISSFLTIFPTFQDVPLLSGAGLALGFGLLLSAMYFLMGLPIVTSLRRGVRWLEEKFNGSRKASPKES